jgi:hypothetical protein
MITKVFKDEQDYDGLSGQSGLAESLRDEWAIEFPAEDATIIARLATIVARSLALPGKRLTPHDAIEILRKPEGFQVASGVDQAATQIVQVPGADVTEVQEEESTSQQDYGSTSKCERDSGKERLHGTRCTAN